MTKLLFGKSINDLNLYDELNLISTINQLSKMPDSENKEIVMKLMTHSDIIYPTSDKKRIMQALRNFDEIGRCNEIWEFLDYLNNDEDALYFQLLNH